MGIILLDSFNVDTHTQKKKPQKWLELSKPLENQPEAKPHESSSPPKPLENSLQPPAASRSHTDSDQEPSPFEKFDDTKNPPNCSSESFHSSDWSEKLLKISKPI